VDIVILLVLFMVAVVLFARLPGLILAIAVSLLALGFAGYQFYLASDKKSNDYGQGRAAAVLVIVGLLAGASLMPVVASAPSRNSSSRKTAIKNPKKTTISGTRRGKDDDSDALTRYDVQERVGVGGMATVYRAVRKDDRKVVALKIPQEKFIADAKFVRRFHREAEVMMRLNHANILKVYEHSSEGAQHYIVMEFLDGDTLESYIEGRRLSLQHAAEILRLTADALRYIHKQGIIHRDIKPGNIMVMKGALTTNPKPKVDAQGVKLMDFGIAAGKVLTRLTMTGARVGTPVYMSPEQARGLKIDHRSDIYSLGLVFYEMSTGTTAFKGGYEAVVHQQIFQTPTPPRQINLEVPQVLNDLIMRMVEKDPDKRPTLNEVIEQIETGLFEERTTFDAPSHLVLSVNNRKGVLRVLDAQGNLERSIGQIGQGEGGFPVAPIAVAVDKDMNLYVSIFEYRSGEASNNSNMIRKLAADGREVLAFGAYGMQPGNFLYPVSLAITPFNDILVLDAETHVVNRFNQQGEFMNKFGGRGKGRGTFDDPRMILAGYDHFIYILDYGNRQVQRFTPDGDFLNKYSFRLRQESDELRVLDGIGVDIQGNLYISDANGAKVRTLKPDGRQGQTYAIQPLQGEDMTQILDIRVDQEGYVYVGRRGGHIIRKFAPDGTMVATIETYAPLMGMAVHIKEPKAVAETSN
jgi:eukaryotic-like serine/threonine-protein kinase